MYSHCPPNPLSAPTRAGRMRPLLPPRNHQFLLCRGSLSERGAGAVRYAKQVTSELSMVPFASECDSTRWLSSTKPSRSSWLPQNLICSIADISAHILARSPGTSVSNPWQQPGDRLLEDSSKAFPSLVSPQTARPSLAVGVRTKEPAPSLGSLGQFNETLTFCL